jgi:hypothetical protein
LFEVQWAAVRDRTHVLDAGMLRIAALEVFNKTEALSENCGGGKKCLSAHSKIVARSKGHATGCNRHTEI